jgi:thiol-disulfide isomerase/thioredoxin
LSDTLGRVVILEFWATWCEPCRTELPHLDRLYDERGAEGLLVVAINVEEDADVALAFADSLGLALPIGVADRAVTTAFDVGSLPTVIVADRQGRVRGRWNEYVAGQEIEISELAERLLTEDPTESVEIARVLRGGDALEVRWSRRSKREVVGVATMNSSSGDRIVATQPSSLAIFDRDGFATREIGVPIAASEIRFARSPGAAADSLVGFRPGSTQLLQLASPDASPRILDAPSPVFGAEWLRGAGAHNLFLATIDGLWRQTADGGFERIGSFGTISGIALQSGRVGDRLVLLEAGKRLAVVAQHGTVHLETALPADSWTLVAVSGPPPIRVVGPAAVRAAAVGRFLEEGETQVAVALGSEQLVLLDSETGEELYRALWPGIVDLASLDLDGDHLEELIVADSARLTALTSKTHSSN